MTVTQTNSKWLEMHKLAKSMGEANDCAVRACAFALDKPYALVWENFRALGRKKRGRTHIDMVYRVMDRYGYRLIGINHYAKTVRTLERRFKAQNVNGTYLVITNGHIFCMKNAEVLDWSRNSLKRIRWTLKVVPR